jgi:hypothetical protein
MRSQSIGTWLGAAALAGVVVVYLKVDQLAAEVRPWIQGRARTERSPVLADWPAEDRRRPPAEHGSAAVGAPLADAPPASGAPAAEVGDASSLDGLAERVARLEAGGGKRAERPLAHWPMPRFASTVKDLAKDLGLSAAQEARVEEVVRRGKQRIEDVLRIPDESGQSPWDRREERRRKLAEAVGKGDKGALLAIGLEPLRERETRIPGREQTYGEEIERIREETRAEIESHLDAGQKETFGDTRIDPLLGENAAVAFSVVTTEEPVELGGLVEIEESSQPGEEGK